MPVLAQFDPQGTPGEAGDALIQGANASQNWMDRAQQRELGQQQIEMNQRKIAMADLERPVKEAELRAQVIGLGASVANQTRMQQLKAQAATVSNTALNEFIDASQLADFDSKATALAGLQAKYQWMGQIPEYKGFIDTINDERVKAHGSAIADAHMQEQLEASRNAQDRAIEVATLGADARRDVAQTNAGSRTTVADTNAGARVQTAEINSGAKSASTDASMARTEVRGNLQSAIESDKEALKFAQSGDEEQAAAARSRAQQFRDAAKAAAHPPTAKGGAGEPFKVPGVTDQPKLYNPPAKPGETISLSPEVKKPEQIIEALQQAVNDGQISADEARETLQKLGFKKKG